MPITTSRLVLRPFTPTDFPALRELDTDPAVLRHRSRQPISAEMTREFLERAQRSMADEPRALYAYAIVLRAGQHWLGQCGLTAVALPAQEAFLSYSLLPRYWGNGYMTEAVRALLLVGFGEFGLQRLFAECPPENVASVRVMEKAGLQYEGHYQSTGSQGKTVERLRYALAGEDYERVGRPGIRVEPPV